MDYNIRVATTEDISVLRELEEACFDSNIRENFEFVLNSEAHIYFVAEKDGQIIGYAGASMSFEQADILNICVKKEHRKNGIAMALLDKLIEHLLANGVENVFLEVEEENVPAISLYKKLGFSQISTRINYYGDKAAIIMLKGL